jgi:cytochrome c biogenesis protein CcmG, thiol:disulfide interchange protein DsbE
VSEPAAASQNGGKGARAWALLPLGLFLALGGLFAWGMFGSRVDRHASPLVGTQAPPAILPALGGGTVDLSSYRGQTVVLNVFASWCAPCRVEHPQLIQMAKDSRFVMLGLAYRDDPSDTAKYLEELGDPYAAVAIDRQGAVGVSFGLTGVPETYVIGPDGIVLKKVTGEVTPRLAADLVRAATQAR